MIWIESLLDSLSKTGLAYSDDAISPALRAAWQETFTQHHRQQLFKPAHIGRESGKQLNSGIRSDSISWLNEQNREDETLLEELNSWRRFLNQTLFLSMRTTEAHFAEYGPGQFYQRHIDRHGNSSARIITFIVYLHESWIPGDGGELVIFKGDTENVDQIIEPLPGRVVLFRSDEIWHEVRKSRIERKSLTGWFRHDTKLVNASKN